MRQKHSNACLLAASNPDLKNSADQTPLLLAVKGGEYYLIRRLIQAGADTHSKDNQGKGMIDYALLGGHTAIAKTILEVNKMKKAEHLK